MPETEMDSTDPVQRPRDYSSDEDHVESVANLPRYAYTALPTAVSSIRILRLLPGEGSDELRGTLEVAAVQSPPSYQAISYAWGAAERPCTIRLEGSRCLPITTALYVALLRLRWPAKTRVLWVDAVCINQADTRERESQVQFMGLIFKQADRVICWLGDDDERQEAATSMDLIGMIGRVSFRSASHGMPPHELMSSLGLPDAGHRVWVSLVEFLNRPWFRRYWVVQEFVVGKRVELMCGTRIVDWRDVDNGFRKLSEHFLPRWGTALLMAPELSHPAPGHGKLRRELPIAESAVQDFRTIMTLRKESSTDDWFYDKLTRIAVGDETLEDLEMEFATYGNAMFKLFLKDYRLLLSLPTARESARLLLELFRKGQLKGLASLDLRVASFPFVAVAFTLKNRLATDPRDRLFALLGITEEAGEPALRPSYSESMVSTYTRFSSHLIRNAATRETLFILLEAGLHSRPAKCIPDLPSWVYDWSQKPIYEEGSLASIVARAKCHHAAGQTLPRVRYSAPSRRLTVAGARVDEIRVMVACASLLGERDAEGNQVWGLTEDGKMNLNLGDPESTAQWISRTKRLMESDDEDVAGHLRRFFSEADGLFLSPERPLRLSRPDETREEIMWRTLITDLGVTQAKQLTVGGQRQRHRSEYLNFRQWLATLEGPYDPIAALDSILSPAAGHWPKMFLNLSQYYAVCTTSSGWAGLVPRCTTPGDEIHIILGGDMPVVLRPVDTRSRTYQLVGACYVHGMMQGEFLRDPGWDEEEICLV